MNLYATQKLDVVENCNNKIYVYCILVIMFINICTDMRRIPIYNDMSNRKDVSCQNYPVCYEKECVGVYDILKERKLKSQ